MSEMLIPFIEDVTPSIYKSMPGIRAQGLDVGATKNNLTISDNIMTPTNTPFAGYLLKSLTRLNLDRITFPKIYKPANTKCQVDVCGSILIGESQGFIHNTGTPISSGDYGANVKANAFDDNFATYWTSAEQSGQNGVSFIGMSFSKLRTITGFTIHQLGTPMSSVKSQWSNDGISWTDINTHSVNSSEIITISFATPVQARAFRLLANANISGGWTIQDIKIAGTIEAYPQATTSSTVTLPSSASSTTDFYKDDIITVTSGTGTGQTRRITAYDGTTKVATLDQPWTTLPTTSSGFALYDGIVSDISPGFDFSTIDYTVYPTVNVLCSLERLTGATASPSMGVPIVTSTERDWVSQAPVISTNATTAYTTVLNLTGRARLDMISSFTTAAGGIPWVRVTIDGTVVFNDLVVGLTGANSQLDFVMNREAQNSLLVEHRSAGAFSSSVAVSYSR